jgi:hypothetical protein
MPEGRSAGAIKLMSSAKPPAFGSERQGSDGLHAGSGIAQPKKTSTRHMAQYIAAAVGMPAAKKGTIEIGNFIQRRGSEIESFPCNADFITV